MRDAQDGTVLQWVTESGATQLALAHKAFWGKSTLQDPVRVDWHVRIRPSGAAAAGGPAWRRVGVMAEHRAHDKAGV